jgi:hypothetical protein
MPTGENRPHRRPRRRNRAPKPPSRSAGPLRLTQRGIKRAANYRAGVVLASLLLWLQR